MRALAPIAFLGMLTCGEPAAPVYPRAPRVYIRMITGSEGGAVGRTAGVPGDYVIRGNGLRVLVAGMSRRANERGRILALQSVGSGASDDLEHIALVAVVDDRAFEVRARSFSIVRVAGRAALHVEGTIPLGRVERWITIADTPSVLALHSRLHASSEDAWLAERIAWAGQQPFVPWTRWRDGEWHDAGWIGTEGRRRAMALGGRGRSRVRAQLRNERGSDVLEHTDFATRSRGDTVRVVLATSRGSLAGAVRRLGWALGRPFPEASIALSRHPPDTSVRVTDPRERTWIRARAPERGRLLMPLPRGGTELYAHASAYGHPASDDVPIAPNERTTLELPPAGLVLVSAIDEASGEPLPFRVRFAGVAGTKTPELGPVWSAAGARAVAISAEETLEIPVPIGVYEVIVTHGPEWSMDRQTIAVTGVGASEVVARLRRELDRGPWIACDLHLHAEPSNDSQVSLRDRIAALAAEGIGFAVATDHNHVTDYADTVRAMRLEMGTVTGVEVTTAEPAFGHFNVYPFPLDPGLPGNGAPEFTGLTPQALFDAVRAEGRIVQVNHPRFGGGIGYFEVTGFDPSTGASDGTYSDDYDAIEVWNGYEMRRPEDVERNIAEWIAMLARGRRVVAVGNSDSHNISNELAGYPRTYVHAERVETLLDALQSGRAFVTNGPMIDLRVEALAGRVEIEVRVFAPSYMPVDSIDLYVGSRIAETFAIVPRRRPELGLRFARTTTLEIEGPTFVLAVVRGEEPVQHFFTRSGIRPLAFTNPVWIE